MLLAFCGVNSILSSSPFSQQRRDRNPSTAADLPVNYHFTPLVQTLNTSIGGKDSDAILMRTFGVDLMVILKRKPFLKACLSLHIAF